MKKFFAGFITAVVLMAVCSFTASYFPKTQDSILKDGVEFLGLHDDAYNFPFSYNGKFGFTAKSNKLVVLVEPIYDEIISTEYKLVPVKMNGKWGAFDTSGETLPSKQPLLECKYDDVFPCDDNHVYVVIGGQKSKLEVRR